MYVSLSHLIVMSFSYNLRWFIPQLQIRRRPQIRLLLQSPHIRLRRYRRPRRHPNRHERQRLCRLWRRCAGVERGGYTIGKVLLGDDECEYGVCGAGEVGDHGGDGDLFGGGDGFGGFGLGELWRLNLEL